MTSVLSAVLAVFTAVGDWIADAVLSFVPMFYDATEQSLTFLGVLCCAALAFNVCFLLISIIQRFLHFAG